MMPNSPTSLQAAVGARWRPERGPPLRGILAVRIFWSPVEFQAPLHIEPEGAVAAGPAEPSGDGRHIVAPRDHPTPNPQPLPSPKKSGASAFCSGVRWSVVISSTEGLERTRS